MKTPTMQEATTAKCIKELGQVHAKGFVSFYSTVAQMIENGYILDHDNLTGKLDIALSNLRCCVQTELVPPSLHVMMIAVDISIEEALEAAKR